MKRLVGWKIFGNNCSSIDGTVGSPYNNTWSKYPVHSIPFANPPPSFRTIVPVLHGISSARQDHYIADVVVVVVEMTVVVDCGYGQDLGNHHGMVVVWSQFGSSSSSWSVSILCLMIKQGICFHAYTTKTSATDNTVSIGMVIVASTTTTTTVPSRSHSPTGSGSGR